VSRMQRTQKGWAQNVELLDITTRIGLTGGTASKLHPERLIRRRDVILDNVGETSIWALILLKPSICSTDSLDNTLMKEGRRRNPHRYNYYTAPPPL
jgi:hypothetical protein